ncbi:MAG: hypothetical protein JJV97_04675 [SAR324 cluster bacterium]|nr:hypothetical protein [SAR324 cluster bacterium]
MVEVFSKFTSRWLVKAGVMVIIFSGIIITIGGCGFQLIRGGDDIRLPNQARSIFIANPAKPIYRTSLELAVERELKIMLSEKNLLASADYIADLKLSFYLISATNSVSTEMSSVEFDYYKKNFYIKEILTVTDQRIGSRYRDRFVMSAKYSYNSLYSNSDKIEIDNGHQKVAKQLALKIFNRLTDQF